jgi:4-hydroxy-tetrahydrodipicolinate reductase
MKLGLLGRGRMGKVVERVALAEGHEIVFALDRRSNREQAWRQDRVAGVDAVVDFTRADGVLANVDRAARAGLSLVVGTTGWTADLERVRALVEKEGTGLVYGANFSIGAELFRRLAGEAGRLFNAFEQYDAYVLEHHHRGKRDAPSGTALGVAERLLAELERKRQIQLGTLEEPIPADALQVTSVRAGAAFGRHQVGFDGPDDTVEIAHTSRSREGFARGALLAARFLRGRRGVFTFGDVLSEEIGHG